MSNHTTFSTMGAEMKLLIAAVLVGIVGCGNLVAPNSGYNPSPPNDPSDSLIRPNGDLVGCFGYNIASGRACGPDSVQMAAKVARKHPVVALDCFSGYVVAYGPDGEPECVPQ